jgi:hypothetical protein
MSLISCALRAVLLKKATLASLSATSRNPHLIMRISAWHDDVVEEFQCSTNCAIIYLCGMCTLVFKCR